MTTLIILAIDGTVPADTEFTATDSSGNALKIICNAAAPVRDEDLGLDGESFTKRLGNPLVIAVVHRLRKIIRGAAAGA